MRWLLESVMVVSALLLLFHQNSLAQTKMEASNVSAKLQSQWKLEPGEVFNRAYVETFVDKNHSLLPADFTADRVQLIEDCRDTSVSVHLHLRYDPQHEAVDRAKRVECSPPADSNEKK